MVISEDVSGLFQQIRTHFAHQNRFFDLRQPLCELRMDQLLCGQVGGRTACALPHEPKTKQAVGRKLQDLYITAVRMEKRSHIFI